MKKGPPISLLFFADDLLLFGQASLSQMEVIMKCMDIFCQASGQRVSVEKTRILVSKNVHHTRAMELSSVSGFGLTSDLGKYLGVPLLHGRKKKETYGYL